MVVSYVRAADHLDHVIPVVHLFNSHVSQITDNLWQLCVRSAFTNESINVLIYVLYDCIMGGNH